MDLKDQIVVITGGSEGLGLALAKKLSILGAKVILLAKNETRLKAATQEITKAGNAEYFVCDVSDWHQVEKTIKVIISKYKTIDILVNNAGIWFEGLVESHSPEKIQELFAVNAIGPIYMIQSVLPLMKSKKYGQIFNISSIAGVNPEPGWPVYVGTKYALRGFTESLEAELAGTGIRVMGFYPGGMNTDLFKKAGFPWKDEPWMMNPDNVADVVMFMLLQPKNVTIDHLVIKSMDDHMLFED